MPNPEMMNAAIAQVDGDPEWLCSQLEEWPRRVHPERTTNISYLMESAAKMLRALLSPPVAVEPDDERAARDLLAIAYDLAGHAEAAEAMRSKDALEPGSPYAVQVYAMLAFAENRPKQRAPYSPPTGDFRCHNCKHVVENVPVAPKRCPKCSCRDFSACAPSRT